MTICTCRSERKADGFYCAACTARMSRAMTSDQKIARILEQVAALTRDGLIETARDCAEGNDLSGLIWLLNCAEGKRGSAERSLGEAIDLRLHLAPITREEA